VTGASSSADEDATDVHRWWHGMIPSDLREMAAIVVRLEKAAS
jgi:hypothetical protein